jgi:SAM-dependent methyltransferase
VVAANLQDRANRSNPQTRHVRRAARYWGRTARVSADTRCAIGWLDSTLVQRLYLHPTISGDPDASWLEYFKRRHLPHAVGSGLVLGCGGGGLERHATVLELCERYDAYDVSPGALEIAEKAARKAGLRHIKYRRRDLNEVELERERYDVVFASMVFHHIENLEHLFGQIRRALRPGGLFVLNEYVGPDRFQWTRRQLMAVRL